MNTDTTTPDPAHLKAQAIAKLAQARSLIDSARADMCNLEGTGYCAHYEKALKLYDGLEKFSTSFSKLAPPTGVFQI